MRRTRMVAMTGAAALGVATFLGATTASAGPIQAPSSTSTESYLVLAKKGADVTALAKQLPRAGATVTSVNTAIGMVTVTSSASDFLATARAMAAVERAATNGILGRSPKVKDKKYKAIERRYAMY